MDALAKKRRDDNDDDEIMLFLLPALYLLGSTRKPRQKMPRHISMLPGKERLEEVLNGHVKDCCVAFRMEPNTFRAIATYLRDEHLLRDIRGVKVEEQLAFFMYMLSHNASYEDIQFEFKHSGETIHRHIKSIFKILPNLARRFVKPMVATTEPQWKISTDPMFFPYFKNCLGVIDGTHIPITISQEKQAPYRNRKGTLKTSKLKREYRMLKEARKRSGASWDEKLCMTVADESTWENIITSYPKARKFKSKPFLLFERLGELYDGHTAEGSLNLTSLPKPSITEISGGEGEEFESTLVSLHDEDEDDNDDDDDDDDVRILDQPSRPTATRKEDGPAVPDGGKKVQKRQKEAAAPDRGKHVSKKQKKEDVTHMMSRYLEVKTKQVECEAADKAKAGSEADEYSIKNCISVIKTMEELTGGEKAKVVDLFKDAQNREIFMSLDSATHPIWIRKNCMQTKGN